ncbi:hypothetical protein BS47DRAFT_1293213 [Hydnum rufescens UP504]|uniref:ABC transporter domain-containing protein n=1 Tax=Hydnum rufescens UP504 TaxID=1448309 RepID=A0A9P6DW23_9AGAM|nr:hypothetical protein BS47DRAFT_1293213 [Hydnum rufescens UP504]
MVRYWSIHPYVQRLVYLFFFKILFALRSIHSPGTIPLKSLTLLTTTITTLGYRIQTLLYYTRSTSGYRKTIVALYQALEIKNILKDGDIPYPAPDVPVPGGMKVEFRNVSFQYPEKDTAVLKNMSFTLNPGQLMVIVGENGCGKSSTVKLLNRLFDMSEGAILIDDLPIETYVAADVRRAQAVMSQEFVKYPLTIRENIGLGSVDHVDDIDRIHRATKLGGAFDFINELPLGFETDIEARSDAWSSMHKAKEGGPLKTKLKELEGEFEISGGQWQRLAISRTLMRAMDNDDIRLLCFDEPSSALDPKAEFELFERLRDFRGQKTLIFITHRFGHLTKFADVILYMKNGEITEQGTHAELLAKGEEYAHLYNIQAQAFST